MGQTVEQIAAQIETRRHLLDANLHELERKVQTVTDWRYYFRRHPMAMLGVAFGGGLLLAGLTTRSHRSRSSGTSHQSGPDALDHVRDALIGIATTGLTNFIGRAIPGFPRADS